jgi:hypothetical protein
LLAGRMLGRMRGMATQARRPDLSGAGFKDTVTEMEALHHAGNDAAAQAAATRSLDSKALKAQGGGQIVSARKNSVARLAPIMLDDLDKVRHTGDVTKYKRELASIAGRYDAMAQVSPENAEIMAKEVLDKKLYEEAVTVTDKAGNVVPVMEADPNNLNVQRQKMRDVSVREAIERNRGDEDFLGMRREYQSSGLAASQASNQAALMQTMQGTPGAPPIVPIPGQQ